MALDAFKTIVKPGVADSRLAALGRLGSKFAGRGAFRTVCFPSFGYVA